MAAATCSSPTWGWYILHHKTVARTKMKNVCCRPLTRFKEPSQHELSSELFCEKQVRGACQSSVLEMNKIVQQVGSEVQTLLFDSHWVIPALVICRWSLQIRSLSGIKLTHRFPEDVQLIHYFRFIWSFLSTQRPQGMEVWASFSRRPAHVDFQSAFTWSPLSCSVFRRTTHPTYVSYLLCLFSTH